jgi:hypothetical protein
MEIPFRATVSCSRRSSGFVGFRANYSDPSFHGHKGLPAVPDAHTEALVRILILLRTEACSKADL